MLRRLLSCNRGSTLLVRPWQNESPSIVGWPAKVRYISTKTTFVSVQTPQPPALFIGLRHASTAVGNVGRPGPNPTSFLDLEIPYIPESEPESSAQIPYVPDFWNSSSPSSIEPAPKETLPKLLVVSGAGTHHGGGPSHNLLDIPSESEYNSVGSVDKDASRLPEERGLWDDIADDVGLPPTKDVKKAIWKLFS